MKILIVDDEHLARERLKDLIGDAAEPHEILEADNGVNAIDTVALHQPDVVLLDIRMPVMDGLEAAHHLSRLEHPPAVIFTTAYQDHAIEAFDANAIDYLLKPIRGERLHKALAKASHLQRSRIDALRDADSDHARTHLSSSSQGRIRLIPVHEIRYLLADQKYVTVGCRDREYLLDESLKALEQEFTGRFLRIHRSTLVALEHIRSLEKDESGGYIIHLQEIVTGFPVSRRHLAEVRQAMKGGK